MAKIGIDARLWGIKHTGIGRYVEELVGNLQQVDKANEYVLFCRSGDLSSIPDSKGWKKVIADINHYSLKEQFTLHKVYCKENLDLLHIPHFNAPIFYKGKFIITIHDLLWHDLKGLKVTTLPAPLYLAKYLAYKYVVKNAIQKSERIIVPSNYVKNDLKKKFNLPEKKIVITYEGVSESKSVMNSESVLEKYGVKKPYLFYVGGLYPHKNVESAVRAIAFFNGQGGKLNFVIASARSVFKDRFEEFLKSEKKGQFVKLLGNVSETELDSLYKNAEGFIFPTTSEGFGLPGLEAMSRGIPVICSDIPVLREVYKDSAVYFDPKNVISISQAMQKIISDKNLRPKLIKSSETLSQTYSWAKMAKQTLEVYGACLFPLPAEHLRV